MKFATNEIKETPLLKSAMEYASAKHQKLTEDTISATKAQIRENANAQLKMFLSDPSKSDEEKAKVTEQVETSIKRETQAMTAQLTNTSKSSFAMQTKALISGLTKIGVEDEKTMAASVLVSAVRSPKDFTNVQKEFGNEIGEIVSEYIHLETYPMNKERDLENSSDAVKNINLVNVSTKLNDISNLIKSGQQLQLAPNFKAQIKSMFNVAQSLRGFNTKADANLVDNLNSIEKISGFTVSVNQDNKLDIIESAIPQKRMPPQFQGGARRPTPPQPKKPNNGFGKF